MLPLGELKYTRPTHGSLTLVLLSENWIRRSDRGGDYRRLQMMAFGGECEVGYRAMIAAGRMGRSRYR